MAKRNKPSLLRKIGKVVEETVFRGSWARNGARVLSLQQVPAARTVSYDLGLQRRGFPPLRVAFVSDLHAGRMTHPDLIREAGKILEENDHDILLFGGDYIFLDADEIDLIRDSFDVLAPRLGKFGVLGNHDRWINSAALAEKMGEAGIKILVNEEVRFSSGFEGLSLYGLDDVEWGEPSFGDVLEGGENRIRLLLSHSPEALSLPECGKFDFALFGHTHAGQIAPPVGKPRLPFKDRFSRRFPYGLYEKGEKNEFLPMYVTSGIGCVWLPVRIFARPEVVFITFS